MTDKKIINEFESLKSLHDLMGKKLQGMEKSLSRFNGRATRKGVDKKATVQILANRFKTTSRNRLTH